MIDADSLTLFWEYLAGSPALYGCLSHGLFPALRWGSRQASLIAIAYRDVLTLDIPDITSRKGKDKDNKNGGGNFLHASTIHMLFQFYANADSRTHKHIFRILSSIFYSFQDVGLFAFVLLLSGSLLERLNTCTPNSLEWAVLFDSISSTMIRLTIRMINRDISFLGPFISFSVAATTVWWKLLSLKLLSRSIWHAAFALWLIINNNRYGILTRLSSHGARDCLCC